VRNVAACVVTRNSVFKIMYRVVFILFAISVLFSTQVAGSIPDSLVIESDDTLNKNLLDGIPESKARRSFRSKAVFF